MPKLTKRAVEGVEATDNDVFVWDDDVQGFGLRVFKSGRRSYLVQYRIGKRTRRYTIGTHGVWTVETARREAKALLGQVAAGIDPADEKKRDAATLSIAEACDQYLEEGMATAKDSSIRQARSNIENHIKPLVGRHLLSSFTRGDVQQLLRDVAASKSAKTTRKGPRAKSRVRGGKGTANRVINTLSAALTYMVDERLRPDNPAIGVKKYPGKKLERFLSPVELHRLGGVLAAAASLGVESEYAIAAIRMLILTGCRKNEILTLRWEWIDRFHKCLRLPDSKTGAKVVHLGAPALRLIGTLTPREGNPHVFPGRTAGTHVTDLQSVWSRIRASAELEDVRIHDLRHSFASIGANNGDSLLIIGALLGHRSAKTTERYAHLADHPVKSAADRISDRIAQHLELDACEVSLAADTPAGRNFWIDEIPAPQIVDPILGSIIRTKWMDTRAAAAFLGMTVGTLQTYRWQGTGPAFQKIGRRVVYSKPALVAWKGVQEIGEAQRAA
jgi:integrase